MNSLLRLGTRSSLRPVQLLINTQAKSTLVSSIAFKRTTPVFLRESYLRRYSTQSATGSAPPPPPPPHEPTDKNAKGKRLLRRITNAFTFSISSVIVVGAAGIALLVVYLILSELFLPSGDTRTFNKAVKLVEKSEVAQKVLKAEKHERLKAYGESHADSWTRNRPVHGIRSKGKDGKDHLLMQFHVEAALGKHGTVTLEQVDNSFWLADFAYIALDVAGSKRVYIIEPKFQSKSYVPKLNSKDGFLGLKWGPKKDE